MNVSKFFLMSLLGLLTFFSVNDCIACNADNLEENDIVYVEAEQIIVTEKGLFLQTPEGFMKLDALFSNDKGLYINPNVGRDRIWSKDKCWNGHPVYHRECGGCAMPRQLCHFRCSCFTT